MFYTEEDISPAVKEAVKLFGTVGNMSMEKDTLFNISIATKTLGKLWYGDISGEIGTTEIVNRLTVLSKFTQETIYILDDNFDFKNPKLTVKG